VQFFTVVKMSEKVRRTYRTILVEEF
jgi:hypothetical protein